MTSKFYRSKSTSSAPSNAASASSGTSTTAGTAGYTGQKSEHSSRSCSKQASEDSDVWGKMESMDEDEIKSQASKGELDADGWENDDEVLDVQNTSASNSDLEVKPSHEAEIKQSKVEPAKGRKSSSNGWEDEFTENMWSQWGLNEPNIKTSTTGPSVNATSSAVSVTEVNKKCPEPNEQSSSESSSTTRGRKTTPGVTKKQGPLKLGAKKIS